MHKKNTRNELRIISGRWRGRKLRFPAAPGIRPTPDRVRETLFNWVQHEVPGSRCLDLFAGSGALGLEALSRGAACAVFVERERGVARYLREALRALGAAAAEVHAQDTRKFLAGSAAPFDLVFLDPPYDAVDLPQVCAALEQGGWLAPGALIYIEAAAARGAPALPVNWKLLKSRRAGAVGYHLARRQERPDVPAD